MAKAEGLPVFSFVDEHVQAADLRDFLTELGAKGLPTHEVTAANSADTILALMRNCAIVGLKSDNDTFVDMVLNSLCSLVVTLPLDKVSTGMPEFCEQLCSEEAFSGQGWNSKAGAAVRVLSNLFHGFNHDHTVSMRYTVYMALLRICARAGLISQLPTELPTVLKWFDEWSLSVQQRRDCLRLLMESLTTGGQTEQPAEVMLTLLATYTDADATAAVNDAKICVKTAINDPKVFILDHLVRLRPVQMLEKSDPKLWQLLKIFVSGSLSDFRNFTTTNKSYVSAELKLNEDKLVDKMRMLTFISLADGKQQVSFGDLAAAVQLPVGEQLEDFIIKALQANAVQAKIDQVHEVCLIRWAQQRTFDQSQWSSLKQRLDEWTTNLQKVMLTVATCQSQFSSMSNEELARAIPA